MLTTKNYNNNSSIYANSAKFNSLEVDNVTIGNVYNKTESDNNFYNKLYIDNTLSLYIDNRLSDLLSNDVYGFLSLNYLITSEIEALYVKTTFLTYSYYSKTQSDNNYYSKTQ